MTVVPHFREFPLISSKQADFERFVRVCEAIKDGKHLVLEGLEQIIRLSMEMNPSGKRKYTSREIVNSLRMDRRTAICA